MTDHDILCTAPAPPASGPAQPPALFRDTGDQAWRKVVEFFTARIRNRNTREAYARAVWQFCDWCTGHRLTLHGLSPFLIAAYVEDLGAAYARPTVKQHLAAIRMLFDFLVVGQVVPANPDASVRGPRHVIK
jgi:site-specific recombinase XerD